VLRRDLKIEKQTRIRKKRVFAYLHVHTNLYAWVTLN